jgi:hypothetical protein
MDGVPGYVSITFILTTFASIGFLLHVTRYAGLNRLPSKILLFVLPLWIFFQAVLSLGGFYLDTSSIPPRLFLFGVGPAFLLIIGYFIFFRSFIDRLPLETLTLLHSIRIPVELVLYWLFISRTIPEVMTFAGYNFDIVSGILAVLVYIFISRSANSRTVLIAFNIVGLILLTTIVSIAIMSLEWPFQRLGFEQPNRAVLYFPYIWLPTIVVPIVLFSHLAALWQLRRPQKASEPEI